MSKASRAALVLAGALLLSAPEPAGGLAVGVVVPDFGMTTLEGRRFSLAEAEKTHSGVVILFLSTICPYSNYYNDLIRDLAAEYAKRNVLFVGVNSGGLETAEEMGTRLTSSGIPTARSRGCSTPAGLPRRSSWIPGERFAITGASPRKSLHPT